MCVSGECDVGSCRKPIAVGDVWGCAGAGYQGGKSVVEPRRVGEGRTGGE